MNRHDSQDHETLANYDAFAATFAKSRVGKYWSEFDVLVGEIGKRDSKSVLKILDVGCGAGRLLETLNTLPRTFEYCWIDESSRMIDEAKKVYPEGKFEALSMQWISKIQDNFDIIAFVASFHHLHTREERILVLRAVRMLLKENGCIFMTNWNLLSTMNQKKYAPREVGGCDFDVKIGKSSRFYHGFDTNELTELFREAGFEYISHDVGERNIVSIARI